MVGMKIFKMVHLMATFSGMLLISLVSGLPYLPNRSVIQKSKETLRDPFMNSRHKWWSYHVDNKDWEDEYPACGGRKQSPISIYLKDTRYVKQKGLVFSGYSRTASNLTMTNTGHTVTLKLQKGLHLKGGGLTQTYIAHKMAFHWGSVDILGSEHMLEGHRFPMEVQIYHYSYKFSSGRVAWKKGQTLVVVAYFVQTGGIENSAFHEIIYNLRMINFKGNQYYLKNWNLDAFLPRNRSCFITYRGSVTFPPCREGVTWIILWETVHVSTEQLETFRSLLSEYSAGGPRILLGNNFRPLQPINDRGLYRSCRTMTSIIALFPSPLRLLLFCQAGIVVVLQ